LTDNVGEEEKIPLYIGKVDIYIGFACRMAVTKVEKSPLPYASHCR
jgi:hypothetical protein